MDKLEILKYICAYDLDYGITDTDLYYAQVRYYNEKKSTIEFDPLLWLCKHLEAFYKDCKIIYANHNDQTPCSVFYKEKCFYHDGTMKQHSLSIICEFYIENKYKSDSCTPAFYVHDYYALHYEMIDKFDSIYTLHKSNTTHIHDSIKLFYIMYGYWNNITLQPVNGLQITASNPTMIQKYGVLSNKSLEEYYKTKEIKKLIFCPFRYAASNIEKVEHIISTCKMCILEQSDRLTKHYIRNGYNEKLNINSFNKYTYLANNYKRIRMLMKKNKNGKTIWDIHRLTSQNVALDYLKRRHKTKKNVFNEVAFVKEYVDHEFVNKSKKLCIENAAEYFVTYYVLNKDVRYNTTMLSKVLDFIQGRTVDTMKQIPLNASRFLIESKCL